MLQLLQGLAYIGTKRTIGDKFNFLYFCFDAVGFFLLVPTSRQENGNGIDNQDWLGCILLGGAFLIMIPAGQYEIDGMPVSMFWLLGVIFTVTVGELYLLPVGLSMVTKLAPARLVSMLMGLWFFSQFIGNSLAGYLGSFRDCIYKPYFLGLWPLSSYAPVGEYCYIGGI